MINSLDFFQRRYVLGVEEHSSQGIKDELFDLNVSEGPEIRSKPYRLGYVLEYLLHQEVDKYLRSGRWRRGSPRWTSPVFLHLVPKQREIPKEYLKSNLKWLDPSQFQGKKTLEDIAEMIRAFYSVRLVNDYRRVNDRTLLDVFPMADVQEFRKFCRGKARFSIIDLKSCFYQILLSSRAKDFLGVVTPDGTYFSEFLGFGPKNAPAASSRMLNKLLAGLENHCMGRIDDILIATETDEEHLEILNELFQRMKNLGIMINAEKTQLFQEQVTFMGYQVDSQGIAVKDFTIEKLKNAEIPKSLKELRSFNGLAEWVRPFAKSDIFAENMAILSGALSSQSSLN